MIIKINMIITLSSRVIIMIIMIITLKILVSYLKYVTYIEIGPPIDWRR